ncbi:helix-turn-helix domain-containing protein [Angustibacter luteus]|uniref:Helix-turn-helix domain-containing protein n=1 Tax=Angustibacter luteus TaxID=658456 RepID=A0ABW1JKI0_9ACTN
MSEMPNVGRVPALTLGWRLKMSLGEMKAEEMGELLGVSRQTLSRWMGDKGVPRLAYIKQWALATGIDYNWLVSGNAENPRPGGPDEGLRTEVRHQGLEPRTR